MVRLYSERVLPPWTINEETAAIFGFIYENWQGVKENKSIGLGNQSNIPCQNLVFASIKSGHVSNSILPGV